jgi:hypothetical protein
MASCLGETDHQVRPIPPVVSEASYPALRTGSILFMESAPAGHLLAMVAIVCPSEVRELWVEDRCRRSESQDRGKRRLIGANT